MAFGLPTSGGGDILPYIKYNAKAGRMTRVDRVQTAAGWESDEVDITDNFSAVFDLENIQVGWAYYGQQGPQRKMGIYKKEPTPEQPDDVDGDGKKLYKSGFLVKIALAKASGGGIREFGSNAGCVVEALGVLHDAYEVAPEAQQGKLPVVAMTGVNADKGQHGTNYVPTFGITGWVDRPETLTAPSTTPAPTPQQSAAAPAATGSTKKAPPQQQAAPAEADEGDFG